MSAPRRVLVICHANTSRSIIAEAVLLRLLASRGLDGQVTVSSGGIAPFARDGSLVSLDARFVLREIGIHLPEGAGATDLKRHPDHIEAADLILAMTEEQRAQLAAKFPESAGKRVLLMRELVGEAGDIDDPSMKDEDVFRFCRDEIVRCLDGGLDTLLAHLEGVTMLGLFKSTPKLEAIFTATRAVARELAREVEVNGELLVRNAGKAAELHDLKVVLVAGGTRRIDLPLPPEFQGTKRLPPGGELRATVAWKIPLAAPMRAPAAEVQLITTAGGKHTPLALSNRFPLDNE